MISASILGLFNLNVIKLLLVTVWLDEDMGGRLLIETAQSASSLEIRWPAYIVADTRMTACAIKSI